jgi:hypothetical protein
MASVQNKEQFYDSKIQVVSVPKHHTTKAQRGHGGKFSHMFWTQTVVEGKWLDSSSGYCTTKERIPGTIWIRSWLDYRDGLKGMTMR